MPDGSQAMLAPRTALRARYGTARGLVRLILAYGQIATGRAHILAPRPRSVRRLVFICQGNVCRSAHAEAVARRLGARSVSFGLSTTAGAPAHPPAVAAAAALGHDLTQHRANAIADYRPQAGDMLFAMEVRQLARIARDPRLAHVPRSLLGLWSRPRRPHLHDPFGLDDRYMTTCLRTVERAVEALVAAFPDTRRADGDRQAF